MSDVEGMGWLKRVWLYGFGPLELVDEEDGVKYYATRSLKRSFRSVEKSNRKYAKRYPHRFRYVEEPADPVHRPLDSYRYRRDVKDMRASGTDEHLIDKAVSILARGDCLPASFDERYVLTDRRDMRDCAVGGGWRLIYCYSEKTLILVGLMMEDFDRRCSSILESMDCIDELLKGSTLRVSPTRGSGC